jgi:hypothetical protein
MIGPVVRTVYALAAVPATSWDASSTWRGATVEARRNQRDVLIHDGVFNVDMQRPRGAVRIALIVVLAIVLAFALFFVLRYPLGSHIIR